MDDHSLELQVQRVPQANLVNLVPMVLQVNLVPMVPMVPMALFQVALMELTPPEVALQVRPLVAVMSLSLVSQSKEERLAQTASFRVLHLRQTAKEPLPGVLPVSAVEAEVLAVMEVPVTVRCLYLQCTWCAAQ